MHREKKNQEMVKERNLNNLDQCHFVKDIKLLAFFKYHMFKNNTFDRIKCTKAIKKCCKCSFQPSAQVSSDFISCLKNTVFNDFFGEQEKNKKVSKEVSSVVFILVT